MARIRRVVNNEHAVQTHHVVVDCLLCTVIVVPESTHLFPWITDSVATRIAAKRVDAGVDVRVEIVFPEAAGEEVARETVALRPVVSVMQVDRYLRVAKRIIAVRRRAVPEPHEAGFAVSIQDRWAWIGTVETPDI